MIHVMGCRNRCFAWFAGLQLLACAGLVAPACHSADPDPAYGGVPRTIDVRVVGRRVRGGPATIRLVRGERALLRWTVDEPMTVHVHGYDVALALRPGHAGSMAFEARFNGRFPISAHLQSDAGAEASAAPARHEPTLLYLEVHPE